MSSEDKKCIAEHKPPSGFTRIPEDADGNCLFRALARQIIIVNNPEKNYDLIRQDICNQEEKQRLVEDSFVNSISFLYIDGRLEDHISNMRRDKTYGGLLEVYMASYIYERPIYYFYGVKKDTKQPTYTNNLILICSKENFLKQTPIFLFHCFLSPESPNPRHYESLQILDDTNDLSSYDIILKFIDELKNVSEGKDTAKLIVERCKMNDSITLHAERAHYINLLSILYSKNDLNKISTTSKTTCEFHKSSKHLLTKINQINEKLRLTNTPELTNFKTIFERQKYQYEADIKSYDYIKSIVTDNKEKNTIDANIETAKNNIKLFDELVEQLNTLTIKENKYLKYKNKYLQLKKSPVL
jgi:hypothetical protein